MTYLPLLSNYSKLVSGYLGTYLVLYCSLDFENLEHPPRPPVHHFLDPWVSWVPSWQNPGYGPRHLYYAFWILLLNNVEDYWGPCADQQIVQQYYCIVSVSATILFTSHTKRESWCAETSKVITTYRGNSRQHALRTNIRTPERFTMVHTYLGTIFNDVKTNKQPKKVGNKNRGISSHASSIEVTKSRSHRSCNSFIRIFCYQFFYGHLVWGRIINLVSATW